MCTEVSKPKILIVDDMPLNIKIISKTLKDDYNIVVATSGEKALGLAASASPPEIILLDIIMPQMDGYEVCRKLKENNKTKNIPVIFISAKGEMEDEAKGLELGAVDYIIKPFSVPIVNARIKTHLSLKRKTEMLERLVFIDGLTEILNRRGFNKFLEQEWDREKRTKNPLSLALISMDSLKKAGDCYAQLLGNDGLHKVAQVLAKSLRRPADLVARYGDEEFAILLPETDIEATMEIAEKIRANVENMGIRYSNSENENRVTLTVGAAQ